MAQTRLPTHFIPHGGGPCFFMDPPAGHPHLWDPMADYLRDLGANLATPPKALLVISAHWEEKVPTLNVAAAPDLLYDYYGFPEHTYRLRYPAPGAPWLADRVEALLRGVAFDVERETQRGWDHGVFIPMMVAFPEATLPILQLSMLETLDPGSHLRLGEALTPLRDEGVLIIGSGMSYHNLRAFYGSAGQGEAAAFDGWLTGAIQSPETRSQALTHWRDAPSARFCHPREEHLLPLMVAAGAGGADPGHQTFQGNIFGKAVSGYAFGS